MLLSGDPGKRRCEGWAREHRSFLGLVLARFLSTGSWPRADVLQRDLARRKDHRDVLAEAHMLPAALGVVAADGRICLTVRGLSSIDIASDLLGDYLDVVKLAFARYGGTDPMVLGAREIAPLVGHDVARLARVCELMSSDRWLFTPAGDQWVVSSEIRRFADATTIAGYLRVQSRFRKQPKAARRRRLRGWLASTSLSVRDTLLVAVVGGLIVASVTIGLSALL